MSENSDAKPTDYAALASEMAALMDRVWFTNLANASALLFEKLPRLNWAGFYLLAGEELVLGPFQGKTACLRIRLGRGVCGTAAAERRSLVVPDVHEFPGHIACDSASNSEIVVPLLSASATGPSEGARLIGVLDLDSPDFRRFTESDRIGLELFAQALVDGCAWPSRFF